MPFIHVLFKRNLGKRMNACIALSLVAVAKSRPDVSHLGPSQGSSLPTTIVTLDDVPESTDGTQLEPSKSYLPTTIVTLDDGRGSTFDTQDEDQRHVYFYGSSEGDLYSKFTINVIPSSNKNTKILFIKSPSHQGVIPEVIAPPSVSEDKTLVYVLVKKPQDGSITIPVGLGTKHSKPEVYFIKYNKKQDAEAQIKSGVQGEQVGSSVPDVGSENAFVGTLDSGSRGDIGDFAQDGVTKVHTTELGETSVQIDTGNETDKFGPPVESGPY
ncbi:hypothetical protein RI129_006037 [Pyrocoelia pectoralis]|uniref:DUF243 domain-containing protein n=1 Tax=Pyrocoelia pectoralis TaxID=417401 RepID=A0AAN7ZJF8_9COLE